MQTTSSSSPFPAQPAPVSPDADLVREVSLRLEHWYRERQLQLPPEVQAGFAEMGVEAIVRNPGRPRDDVLDDLITELDASLSRIKSEPQEETAFGAPADADARSGQRSSWWRRLTGRG